MGEMELNLDFSEPVTSRKKLGFEEKRKARIEKKKAEKAKHLRRREIEKIKAAGGTPADYPKKPGQKPNAGKPGVLGNPTNLHKKRPLEETVKRPSGEPSMLNPDYSRPKKVKPNNNPDMPEKPYIRPAFVGTFNNLEAMTKNLFEETEIPDLPAQREVHREELFSENQTTFESLNLHEYLNGNLKTIFGHTGPTVVQSKAVPVIMTKVDTLIRSQTGSGKTLAYMLPMFDRMMKREEPMARSEGVNVIIVLPTRELVLQTYDEAVKLTRAATNIVACALTGGASRKSEKARLRKGVHILMGTPGRLIDHLEKTETLKKLPNLETIVLDEADRMLEMGYMQKIKHIYMLLKERIPDEKPLQSILLSATLSENVESLAELTLTNPERIVLDETTEATEKFAIPTTLTMKVCVVPPKLRLIVLATAVLEKKKTLVFTNTMAEVNFIHEIFTKVGLPKEQKMPVYKLHGDMAQPARVQQLKDFLASPKAVMIATDVAARGLDLPNVENIIQFSPPGSARDYVQRIGRTARKGNFGQSMLFLLPSEVGFLSAVAAVGAGQWDQVRPDQLLKGSFGKGPGKGSFDQKMREDAANYQNHIESYLAENESLQILAIDGYCAFIRSYAAYPSELKTIFHVKKLHLGHLAKSFGIRKKPSEFLKGREDLGWAARREDAGAHVDEDFKARAAERKEKRQEIVRFKTQALMLDEFSSGM